MTPIRRTAGTLAFLLLTSCNVHFDVDSYSVRDVSSADDIGSDLGPTDTGSATDIAGGDDAETATDLGGDAAADAGPSDVGTADMADDVGMTDVGMTDVGVTDVGVTDGGMIDGGMADMADSGPTDMGLPSCTGFDVVAYYPFDAYNNFGAFENETDVTAVGPALPSASLPLVAGAFGQAPQFDGVDDYIAINHVAPFLLEEGTVSLWVYASAGASGSLFSKDASGTSIGGHFGFSLTAQQAISVRLQEKGLDHNANSLLVVPTDTWTHVAVSFGPAGLRLYLGGILQVADTYTGGLYDSTAPGDISNTEPIAIGAHTGGSSTGSLFPLSSFFVGAIDEVAIIGTQLTDAEVGELLLPACDLSR